MGFLRKLDPEYALRLGLGAMYLYSGYSLFTSPESWAWYVPQWFSEIITPLTTIEAYLQVQGIGEIVLGLLFLAWFLGKLGLRLAALAAVVEMALIIIFVGVNPITFRDIGLLGAAAALVIISWQK